MSVQSFIQDFEIGWRELLISEMTWNGCIAHNNKRCFVACSSDLKKK